VWSLAHLLHEVWEQSVQVTVRQALGHPFHWKYTESQVKSAIFNSKNMENSFCYWGIKTNVLRQVKSSQQSLIPKTWKIHFVTEE
jgi:hypothetical protein